MMGVSAAKGQIEKRSSFLTKRSKRLLFLRLREDRGHDFDLGNSVEIKVFLLLFLQKKKAFTWCPS
jgi:hypothetical protein